MIKKFCFLGPLLKNILYKYTLKANNKLKPKNRKLYLYAGHDSTVVHLLNALDVWDEQIPDYNILLLMELHEIGEEKFGLKV